MIYDEFWTFVGYGWCDLGGFTHNNCNAPKTGLGQLGKVTGNYPSLTKRWLNGESPL
jgi:hypothetical protein